MINRPPHVTVVILSEEEAKELSVRYALRCMGRDMRLFCRALARHGSRYCGTFASGFLYSTRWWTRS